MERPSMEERMLAAVAHMGMFFMGWGLAGAVVIWVTSKSAYVRQHGQQATVWQMTYAIIAVVLIILMALSLATIIILLPGETTNGGLEIKERGVAPVIPFAILGLAGIVYVAFIIGAVAGAIKAWKGTRFDYPLVGKVIGEPKG